MRLLRWLFDGPRIRGQILKRIAELEHSIPGLEAEKTQFIYGMFLQDYEYTRGKLDQIVSEINYLKGTLKFKS